MTIRFDGPARNQDNLATAERGETDDGAGGDQRVTRITPTRGWARLGLREVWAYRELLYFLALRDVKVRYKQTVIGAGWAILQPLLTTLVFTLVFGRLAQLPSDGAPYAVFALAGLVPWLYFSANLQTGSLSLVTNVDLVSKVYFPRLCLPTAALLAGLVDFGVSLSVLVVATLLYGIVPGPALLFLPALIVLTVTACLGIVLWLAAVNVRYRDVRQAIPFLVQIWLFASPIAYPSTLIDGALRYVYAINPMVGVVEGFRWVFLGTGADVLGLLLVSTISALLLLISGAYYFRRAERSFADVI